jgi:hypothetical protein
MGKIIGGTRVGMFASWFLLVFVGCQNDRVSGTRSQRSTHPERPAMESVVVEDPELTFRYPERLGRLTDVSRPSQIPPHRRAAVVVDHPRYRKRPGIFNVVNLMDLPDDKLTGRLPVTWLAESDFQRLHEHLAEAIDVGEHIVFQATWKLLRQKTGDVVSKRALDMGASSGTRVLAEALEVSGRVAGTIFDYHSLEAILRREASCAEADGQFLCWLRPYRTILGGTVDHLFVVRATKLSLHADMFALGFDDFGYQASHGPTVEVPAAFDAPSLVISPDRDYVGLRCRQETRRFAPVDPERILRAPIDWPEVDHVVDIWTASEKNWVWLSQKSWVDMAFDGALFRGGVRNEVWAGEPPELKPLEIVRFFDYSGENKRRFLFEPGGSLIVSREIPPGGEGSGQRALLELAEIPAPVSLRHLHRASSRASKIARRASGKAGELRARIDEIRHLTIPSEALPRVGLCQLLDRSW